MKTAVFRVWRGDASGGKLVDYQTEVSEGMVVLDAIHRIQATQANDLACRWNCKAGKCGSCSAEINGRPKLMCMTRLDELPLDKSVTIEPMKAFPRIRDLATDVSWNFRVKKRIKKFKPRAPDAETRCSRSVLGCGALTRVGVVCRSMKRAISSVIAERIGGDQLSTPRAMLAAAIAGAAVADLTYNALRG